MEHPPEDILPIIHALTEDRPSQQNRAVARYFTPNAAFTHPFCATGSWIVDLPFLGEVTSKWAILQIYQWYKILSPRIDLEVISATFNDKDLKLYVDIHQHFRLWMVPFYDADVRLTTVLQLAEGDESGPESALLAPAARLAAEKPYSYAAVADPERENGRKKTVYYIAAQNDLYQTSEFIKFLVPWGIGSTLVVGWQLFATLLSILGAMVFFPQTWWKERSFVEFPRKI